MGMGDGGPLLDLTPNKDDVRTKPIITASSRSKHSMTRACDACFAQKERCIRIENGKACQRCQRLSKPCLSNRPVRAVGRKRLLPPSRSTNESGVLDKVQTAKLPYSLHPFGELFQDLRPQDEMMVRQFVDPANFTRLMVMPCIGKQTHEEAVQVFIRHYDDLQDGCFSMYGAFASAMNLGVPEYDAQTNIRRATKALKKFTALDCPHDMDDFVRWLWLALTVSIYAHCELGSSAAPVRRTILTHLAALGPQGEKMRKHPLVVSFTTLDILECLFYRQRPVMDLDEGCAVGLNSFPGLASPLIRFLYRLCMINGDNPFQYGSDYDRASLHNLLSEVEVWQPHIDPGELSGLSPIEINHVLTRTRVHKTAILLYIHRIRYPFGHEDKSAKMLSMSILSDLDMATATASRPPEWVSTPFLLAAIELEEPRKRTAAEQDLHKYVDGISPAARAMALDFLKALWKARDARDDWRWTDAMDCLPPLCIYI